MRRAFVAFIVLATVFSVVWYKIVKQRSLECPTRRYIFLIYSFVWMAGVYTEKIQMPIQLQLTPLHTTQKRCITTVAC